MINNLNSHHQTEQVLPSPTPVPTPAPTATVTPEPEERLELSAAAQRLLTEPRSEEPPDLGGGLLRGLFGVVGMLFG